MLLFFAFFMLSLDGRRRHPVLADHGAAQTQGLTLEVASSALTGYMVGAIERRPGRRLVRRPHDRHSGFRRGADDGLGALMLMVDWLP